MENFYQVFADDQKDLQNQSQDVEKFLKLADVSMIKSLILDKLKFDELYALSLNNTFYNYFKEKQLWKYYAKKAFKNSILYRGPDQIMPYGFIMFTSGIEAVVYDTYGIGKKINYLWVLLALEASNKKVSMHGTNINTYDAHFIVNYNNVLSRSATLDELLYSFTSEIFLVMEILSLEIICINIDSNTMKAIEYLIFKIFYNYNVKISKDEMETVTITIKTLATETEKLKVFIWIFYVIMSMPFTYYIPEYKKLVSKRREMYNKSNFEKLTNFAQKTYSNVLKTIQKLTQTYDVEEDDLDKEKTYLLMKHNINK